MVIHAVPKCPLATLTDLFMRQSLELEEHLPSMYKTLLDFLKGGVALGKLRLEDCSKFKASLGHNRKIPGLKTIKSQRQCKQSGLARQ